MAKQLNVSIGVTADTSQAKMALQQLQTQLTQLTSTPANFTLGGSIKKDAVEASKAIAQLQVQLKNATNINTGNLDLTKFNQSMKASNMSLEKYRLALTSMGTSGQQAFAALANSISQAEVPLRRSNSALKEFGTTIMNTARWQLSSSIIHGIMGSIQGAYNYAQKLNESLNRIQIVTEASDASMARFAEQANKAAKALSTTTTSYTDAALIYYQQGFRDEKDIASRVETTIKMANASGQSAEKVSNQMTAIWNNFAKGSTNLEYYADVITALGAATASSSEEIATGLQKFASVADTVGLSYENATAALATITATTRQSADSVGTGLRTLFARLQSLSLGDTLEDGVTLTKYSKVLDQIGVSVLDASGNLRQMDDILAEMGAKWDKLNDAQKTAVAQTVGGVRQYTTLMALMENFDTYQQNVGIAKNSEGTVSRQADIYAKSWEAAQKRVKASAQTIYSDLIDDKFFINLNDNFAKFLNQIHNTITAFGGLKGILLGIGTLITTVFADKAATKLQNFAYNIQMLTPKGRQQVQSLREQGANMLVQNAGQGSDFMNQTMSKAYAEQGALQNAYLANAQRMTTEQQNIAQAMMQQQQALIKNVQLQAEAVQNSQKQAKQDEINAKRLVNEATWAGGKVQKDFIKGKVSEVATEAKNFGKIDTFLSSFDGKTITNIDQVANSIQNLGLGFNEFEKYAAGAGQIFQNLKNALADPNMDPATKLATIQQALDQLNTIRGNGEGGAALQRTVNRLKELADGANMSEESVKAFKKTLDDLVASATRAGGAEQNLGAAESQLTGFTKMLAAAMDELAAKQYTTAQAIVNLAGALSSLAMIWTNIKNLTKTWNDDSLSFGDKLASTLTTLGPTLMMASNGLKNFLPSVIKLGQGIGTSIPIISSLNTAITGVAGSAVAAVASFATFAAIAAAIGIGVYALAKSIETTGERLKRLTTNSENARESAENAKEAYQNLLSLQSQHNDLLESINQLTEGTMEFRDALIQANSVAQQLIQIGGLKFGTDWWYNDKGLIEFNKDSVVRTQEQLLRREEDTAKASAMANALLEGAKNGQEEDKGIKEAKKELQEDYNSYTNFMNEPLSHTADIANLMQVDDIRANAIATELANNFMNPLNEYRQWLESGNKGSYKEFFDAAKQDYEDYFVNGITDELSNYGELYGNYLQNYNPEYMAQQFKDYQPLFSGASSLENFVQNVIGERQHFVDLENSELRQTNSQLAGVLTQIERDQSGAIGSDVLASLIKEDILRRYSDDDALNAKEDQIRKKITSSDMSIEDQYRTAFHYSKTDKLPSDVLDEQGNFNKDKAIDAIANLELYNDFVQEFMDTREKYMLDNVSQYDDFLSQNTAGVQNYISQLDREAQENPDKYFSASRLSDYMIKQVQKSYDNAWEALLDTDIDTDDETTKAVVDSLSSAQRDTFADIIKTNSSTFGKDSATILAQSILNNPRLLNDVSRLGLTGQKVKDLKKVQDSDLEFRDELYQSMLKGAGGRKGLLEELYESEDFNKNLKTLQKTFEKTGQIGADAITKIADSSEEFADLLDISGINAATLADVLEAIEIGDVSGIESLSEELINAFTAASGLQQTLAEVFQYIDNFQQTRSTTDIGKFYKGLTDNVENGWQAGLTSDPALLQAWGEMFGQQSMNEYLSALIDLQNDKNLTPDEINAQLESRFGNEIAAMQSIQENNNISGLFDYYAKKSPKTSGEGMFTYNAQTGQVEAVNEDVLRQNQWDTEQGFIQGLVDNYNIDENLAKAMAAEYSSANAFVGNLWQQSNVNAGIEALIGTSSGTDKLAQHTQTESGMTTVSDLEAFYRQYSTVIDDIYDIDKNLDYDSRMAQFVEQAGNAAKANGQQLISLGKNFSFVGKGIEDIDSALQKESQTNLKDFLRNFTGKDEKQQTIQDLVKAFKSLGATSSQALDLANEQINDTYGSLEKYNEAVGRTHDQWEEYRQWCKDYGRETDLSSYMDWEATLADAEKMQKQAELVAKSIGDAFKNIFSGMEFVIDDETHTISIKFKTEGEEEVKQVAEEAEEPKDADVTIQPNTELYDQVMKDVLSNKVVKVFLEYANGDGSGEVGSNSDGSYNTSTSGFGGAGGTPPSQRESKPSSVPGSVALPGTTASTNIPTQDYLSIVGQYADWAIGRVGSDFKGGQTLNSGLWGEFVAANGGGQSGLPDWMSLTQGLAGTGLGDQLLSSNHLEAAAALSHVNDFAPQIKLTSDSISELSSAIGEEQDKKDTGENVQKRFGNKTVSGEDNQQGKTDTREEDKPQIDQEKLKAMARGIIEAQQEGRNPSDDREEKPMPTPQKESSKPDTSGGTTGKSSKDTKIKVVADITEADSKAIEPVKIKAEADFTSGGKKKKEEPVEVPVEINEDQVDSLSEKEVSMPVDLDPNTDKVASYIAEGAQKVVDLNTGNNQPAKDIAALPASHTLDIAVTVSISASNSFGSSISAAGGAGFLSSAVGGIIQDLAKSEATNHPAVQQLIRDTQLHMQCRAYDAANAECQQTQGWTGTQGKASGGLIGSHAKGGLFRSYVNGSANRYGKPGLSLTAEEGPEIVWNKMGGYAYIVGGEGHPEFAYLQPGDRIFNANDTRQILNYHRPKSNENSAVRDPRDMGDALFGSHSVGYGKGPSLKGKKSKGGKGGKGGGGGSSDDTFKPERYHLISRQLEDLIALYDELAKAKENAYGVNILKAIDKEIEAKQKLLDKNRELLAEAEEYLAYDEDMLWSLGIPADFDENGNIANYDELQYMYKKVAETSEDEEEKKAAQEAWDAITQYEETLDKIRETKAEITDLIYELSDMALERIQVKAELRVDFDEREIKFIQHFIDKMDDDITKTSQVLDKVTQQMGLINDKINTTRTAIDEVFASMTNSKGEKINVTYDQWLKMTDAEREALDINHDYGKQLEEYSDDILDYIEALEEYKTRGVEELGAAFDELNEKVTSQIDLFSHYNSLLSSLRDLADLQGLKLPDSYRQAVNKLNQSMVQVTKNNIQAQQSYYAELQDEANKLQQKINETSDFDLKKAYQEQLDNMESMMRDTAENILSLWQEGLQKAKDIFDQEIEWLKQDYEAGFSDLYNTADLLQGAYDRKKELNEQYVDDYEKYYQLGKLQRQINKDLDQAAVNGNKQNKNLKALLEEIQKLQKDGSELSAYDLDILAKKYEYEKALADLEDARNAKQIVRLQRDRNGNWGYVYTAADGDELAEQEQAIEDKLYEYTKAATEQSKDLQSQILSLWAEAGNKIAEMRAAGVSNDVIDDYIADTQAKLDFLMSQLEKTGTDVSLALPKWIAITNESFNLTTDTFTETILSLVTGMETIVETSDTISNSILKIAQASKEAADAYNNSVASLNQLAQGNGMDFMKNAQAWADTIAAASYKNVENTKTAIAEMSSLYDQILDKAKAFEREFMKTYEPIIERNEKFLQDLIGSLSELNKNHHALPAPPPVQEQPKQEEDTFPWWRYGGSSMMMFMGGGKAGYGPIGMPVGFDTGGFTGTWGPDGRLAFLHEKENVFDQDDTVNLLKAANILKTLDTQTGIFEKGLGNFINPNVKDNNQTFEQNVNITAEFPNATSHSEIEEAFDNLVNRATQYANRKVG